MKKIKLLLAAILLLLYMGVDTHAATIQETEIYARSACLLDAASGRVLYSKNGTEQLPMASTTKIMTCILALEAECWDEIVTVSDYAASQPKVHMGANAGEKFLFQDLLYALMLNSDNDAAVMIGEHVSGSVEKFAEKMNAKARSLGCTQTNYVTPNGLDGENEEGVHSTTAEDLAKVMKYCVMDSPKKDLFLAITQTPSYTFWNTSKTRCYNCTNHNSFLDMMDGAISGKTGFTNDAGYCYVGALSWEGETYVVALLACGWPNNKGYKWADTRKLMTYALQNYSYRNVFKNDGFALIPVEEGAGEYMEEVIYMEPKYKEERPLSVLMKEDEAVEIIYELPEKIQAPVEEGEKIGEVIYRLEGEELASYDVVASSSVARKNFRWYMEQVGQSYLFVQ